MTTHRPSLRPVATSTTSILGPTLADVLARLPSLEDVSSQARQNMASAVRTLCRITERKPGEISIAAPALRNVFDKSSPGVLGISGTRWRNVKSDVRRAIRLSELSTECHCLEVPLSSEWEELALRGPDATRRSILRRLGRFCSARQLSPREVNDKVVAQYRSYLDENQLSRSPDRSVADLIRTWNRFEVNDHSNRYQKLAAPNRTRKYTLEWADLPSLLKDDVDAFLEASLHPDPLDADARRAVRPATVYGRSRLLRRIATAEILGGVLPSNLNNLADLVHPDRLRLGLQFFLDRNDGKPNQQVADVTSLALLIASRWVKAPEDQIDQLRLWSRKFRRVRRGLTDKNRERLRQFTDEDVIRRFVTLPHRMVAAARKMPVSPRSARKVQTALALAILFDAPIRIGNLLNLDRHRHFCWGHSNRQRVLHLVIPAAEVKNDVDLEFPLPPATANLLDLYYKSYQPLLLNGAPSSLLFPGRTGATKRDTALRRQIIDTIRDEVGLTVNPHLFRHLAALLFLNRYPGHYEEVRRILGHKNINTTIQFYAGLETTAAVRRYDDMISEWRTPEVPKCAKRRRKR